MNNSNDFQPIANLPQGRGNIEGINRRDERSWNIRVSEGHDSFAYCFGKGITHWRFYRDITYWTPCAAEEKDYIKSMEENEKMNVIRDSRDEIREVYDDACEVANDLLDESNKEHEIAIDKNTNRYYEEINVARTVYLAALKKLEEEKENENGR